MREIIVQFELENEMDIIMAHKRAVQVGELTGLSTVDQTRFATAVSEIARNCIEYAGKGNIIFSIEAKDHKIQLFAKISDKGPGIQDLENILSSRNTGTFEKGVGIINAKKLIDFFDITTSEKGTQVTLGKQVADKHPPINQTIVQGWAAHFKKEIPVSPYEEIKKRNMQLLELFDQLKSKKMNTELQLEENHRLNDLLEQKNENLKQLTYLIAHDLKNPINNIRMCCTMFDKASDDEEKKQYISMINKSADRLLNVTEELQHNIDQDPEIATAASQSNLKNIIQELEKQFSVYLDKVNGKIITRLNVEELYYPEVYLYSILTNLITNSIKYSAEQPLKITIHSFKENDRVYLEFIDNGIGINLKKHRDQLFKPFQRFTEKSEGKGIGLSIISHLISKNGGNLNIESEPGQGCKFICCLVEYDKLNVSAGID